MDMSAASSFSIGRAGGLARLRKAQVRLRCVPALGAELPPCRIKFRRKKPRAIAAPCSGSTVHTIWRLGALTQGASAFRLHAGAGGRIAAVPYQIPPQEAARDRGALQRLNRSHNIGRQMIIQRQRLRGGSRGPGLRGPGRQGPNNQRPGGGQNLRPGPAGPQPLNRPQRLPGQPRPRKNILNEPKR